MTMVRLRPLSECLALAEAEFQRYWQLYHRSCRGNGEVAKMSVYYANLLNNSAKRRAAWEKKIDSLN